LATSGYYSITFLEGLNKTTNNLLRSQVFGLRFEHQLPEEAGVPVLQPDYPVTEIECFT
jgi:hypothetical protein